MTVLPFPRRRSNSGSVSAFVVCLAMTFIVVAGLAVDSGRLVATQIAVADHAENAARVAVQQVRGVRSGERSIDPTRARAAATQYLSRFDVVGEVRVEALSVTVTTWAVESMTLLRLVGIDSKSVSATRRAELVNQ